VISVISCFLIILHLRKRISAASAAAENKYIEYSGVLDRAWENLTLGNSHNQIIWREQNERTGHQFYATSYKLQVLKQIGNITLATASLGPTIFLMISALLDRTANPAVIAAIIVNLTRIFLILNSLSALVYKILDWSSMRARLKVLFDVETSISDNDGIDRGILGSVSLNGSPVTDVSELVRLVRSSGRGRFTLTGANGSGKSTLLIRLKSIFSEESFILPSQQTELMFTSDTAALSTGQRAISHLKEALSLDGINYLLLDEWDANLDELSKSEFDNLLDEIGKSKAVIEVRH
jgi:hypothetical protein